MHPSPRAARGTWPVIEHDRNGVGHAVANRRDAVRGAGSGRHHKDADLTGRAGIAGRHESGALLTGGYDELDGLPAVLLAILVETEDGVVGRKNSSSAVSEDGIDTLVGKSPDDDVPA